MKLTNSPTRFGGLSILNHWITAVLIFGMLGFGWLLEEMPKGPAKTDLMQLHKSIGLAVLALVVLRVVWAWLSPKPDGPAAASGMEAALARLVRIVLWVGLLGLPLTGWLMSAAGGHPVSFFGLFDMPALIGKNETLHEAAEETHGALAATLVGAIALHVAAALKHHFLDRDATLARMLPWVAGK